MMIGTFVLAAALSLNGSWEFRFEEGRSYKEVGGASFEATGTMPVPACYDMMPAYLCKRGSGLYRRTFVLDRAVENAWLVVDGMGLTGRFEIDGRDLGVHPYPYARLELPTGPLAAGEHTVFAVVDNRFDWEYQRLARPYYDFYCFGGFYHGVSLEFDARTLLARTRDYRTGEIELEVRTRDGATVADFDGVLTFDGKNEVRASFREGRARVKVPRFRLWSPEQPNLHTVMLRQTNRPNDRTTSSCSARFGIRAIEAKGKGLCLNGKPLYLRGANRHESHPTFGAATDEKLMALDLQNLKSLGANFVRGCHYQQAQKFLDLCDETGVLVWEESLGWGNGQDYTRRDGINELEDPDFIEKQVRQTQLMVRNSFNHPSVIIFAFLNEQNSGLAPAKTLTDTLVRTIKAEDSGRLVTFACNKIDEDICHENTDLVAFNTYPGTINGVPGSTEELRKKVFDMKTYGINSAAMTFRARYPDKPIIISEIGVGAEEGADDPSAPFRSEDFQIEYLNLAAEAAYASPDIAGLTFWQYHDTRTCGRDCGKDSRKPHAMSCAGLFTWWRRPKRVIKVLAD